MTYATILAGILGGLGVAANFLGNLSSKSIEFLGLFPIWFRFLIISSIFFLDQGNIIGGGLSFFSDWFGIALESFTLGVGFFTGGCVILLWQVYSS